MCYRKPTIDHVLLFLWLAAWVFAIFAGGIALGSYMQTRDYYPVVCTIIQHGTESQICRDGNACIVGVVQFTYMARDEHNYTSNINKGAFRYWDEDSKDLARRNVENYLRIEYPLCTTLHPCEARYSDPESVSLVDKEWGREAHSIAINGLIYSCGAIAITGVTLWLWRWTQVNARPFTQVTTTV